MPAPVGPLLGFVVGVGFAWSASDTSTRLQDFSARDRALGLVALFGMLVHAPIAGYFMAYAPDWSLGYWIDSNRIPEAGRLALMLVTAASPTLGFALVTRGRAPRRSTLVRVAIAPAVLGLAWLTVSFSRLTVSATYTQYHADFGTNPVAGSPLGYALLLMLPVWVIGWWWTGRALQRPAETQSR